MSTFTGSYSIYPSDNFSIRYSCPADGCDKTFSSPSNTKRHLVENHIDFILLCSYCPIEGCYEEFAHKNSVIPHLRKCHPDIRPPYSCPFEWCDKAYWRGGDLSQHLAKNPKIHSALGPEATHSRAVDGALKRTSKRNRQADSQADSRNMGETPSVYLFPTVEPAMNRSHVLHSRDRPSSSTRGRSGANYDELCAELLSIRTPLDRDPRYSGHQASIDFLKQFSDIDMNTDISAIEHQVQEEFRRGDYYANDALHRFYQVY